MSEHATLSEYLNLSLPIRAEDKPRDTGLTMVMDQGWPTDFVAGMLEQFGRYLEHRQALGSSVALAGGRGAEKDRRLPAP